MLKKLIFSSLPLLISSLNNGFTLPAMGYSSWNDCSSFRDNGQNGWCWQAEEHIKNITLYMQTSGLAKLGYNRVNVDEVSSKRDQDLESKSYDNVIARNKDLSPANTHTNSPQFFFLSRRYSTFTITNPTFYLF